MGKQMTCPNCGTDRPHTIIECQHNQRRSKPGGKRGPARNLKITSAGQAYLDAKKGKGQEAA